MKGRKSNARTGKAGATARPSQNDNGYASGGAVKDCMAMGGRAKRHLGVTSAPLHGTAPMGTAAVGQARRPKKDGGAVAGDRGVGATPTAPIAQAGNDAKRS